MTRCRFCESLFDPSVAGCQCTKAVERRLAAEHTARELQAARLEGALENGGPGQGQPVVISRSPWLSWSRDAMKLRWSLLVAWVRGIFS